MKILCDRQQLQEAFHVVGATAPTKTTRNILQHVMLRASGEELTLFATDEELSARMEITGVKVKQEGSMLLPARETMALLKELQHPTVSLERSEFRCNLESGTDSFVLLGDDPDQFPSEPKLEESTVLKIPSVRFLEMVQQTAFAAAREETRYAINGVLVERNRWPTAVGGNGRSSLGDDVRAGRWPRRSRARDRAATFAADFVAGAW